MPADDKVLPITTTTKNALITTQLGPCDVYPHRVKVSIVGIGKLGMACAIAILLRRLASEVCLIDHDANKASAEAEDIQHVGVFLGSPLITGTSDFSMVKESAVVIISACETGVGETPNVKHNFKMFKTIVPSIAKFACKSVLLVVTKPTDVMSYITWKLSGFPSNRVLGTGTLIDCARFQDFLSKRLNTARSSVSCMTIGAHGDMAVPIWSSVHVGGMKLRDINPRIGQPDDPEKWYEVTEAVKNSGKELDEKKGLNCWGHALCTSEIVDAIVRNTKVVLPASTHIHSCTHGTDKDVFMSVPCVIGREGVYCTVRQKLTDREKTAVQTCADSIRFTLRECGLFQESKNETNELLHKARSSRRVLGLGTTSQSGNWKFAYNASHLREFDSYFVTTEGKRKFSGKDTIFTGEKYYPRSVIDLEFYPSSKKSSGFTRVTVGGQLQIQRIDVNVCTLLSSIDPMEAKLTEFHRNIPYSTTMAVAKKKWVDINGNTASCLLTNQPEKFVDRHRVKIVIVGSGYTGVAAGLAILFKRLASELVFIDLNEDLAKAEAEDISHGAAFLGNPKIVGTKDYSLARDATVCVITIGDKATNEPDRGALLNENLELLKEVVPNVCKYAPNSVLLIATTPVDILSYVAMKLSGFPPQRVIGLGTFLDSCRLRYFIAQKLGISSSAVQASVICENGPTSVPVWSAVTVMGIKLKDINKDIGTKSDPESWGELHRKVIDCDSDLVERKGYRSWGVGICAAEVVDAVVRNTCICITVSAYLKGCRHGLEKDVYMSLPCIVGRNGIQSFLRHPYTPEEQELTETSCRAIYETQRSIVNALR
ncbi:uncharacterized protein LOC143148413 [Ptiloglossa arizonensis]|uniref:uncharacterized protein LOC143148413 n=1 Tax=Ptiloglossa arizonensis TaxID=3350558 RepID=UPI003FA01B8F